MVQFPAAWLTPRIYAEALTVPNELHASHWKLQKHLAVSCNHILVPVYRVQDKPHAEKNTSMFMVSPLPGSKYP